MKSSSVALRHLISLSFLMIAAGLFIYEPSSTAAHGGNANETTATADLVVSKSGEETAPLGGLITYTISVYNAGPDDAANVVMTDVIPAHTTFVSANITLGSGSASFDGTKVTATLDTLAFDNTAAVNLVVRVNNDTARGTTINNTADVTSSTPDNDTSNNSATAPTVVSGPFSGDLLISEFRLSGPGGAFDEFIELYNNTEAPLVVNTTDDSSGWAVAASDGIIRFTIPNGTVIPARGHFLGVSNLSASAPSSLIRNQGTNLAASPGDVTYESGIPNDMGIAVFRTANTENFSVNTRLDSVGSTAEANTLYKEGTGYPALGLVTLDHAWLRDNCGKGGSTSTMGPCPTHGLPKDTDNNATDFYFVDTQGTNNPTGQRLGAPGAEGLLDPVQGNEFASVFSLDRTLAASGPPNRVRDFTSDIQNNSLFGTLEIRRRVENNSGFPISRLRFRIIDISTFASAGPAFADLRARTSTDITVSGINDNVTCPGGVTPCSVTVTGTTLEQPPSQPNGGGFNSTLSSDTIALGTPLPAGESINIRFLLGVQKTGSFKFYVNVELLTDQSEPVEELTKSSRKSVRGQTRASGVGQPTTTPTPVVQIVPRQTPVEVRPTNQFRFVPMLHLNTPPDDVTTTKKGKKKKKQGKKVATTAK